MSELAIDGLVMLAAVLGGLVGFILGFVLGLWASTQ